MASICTFACVAYTSREEQVGSYMYARSWRFYKTTKKTGYNAMALARYGTEVCYMYFMQWGFENMSGAATPESFEVDTGFSKRREQDISMDSKL